MRPVGVTGLVEAVLDMAEARSTPSTLGGVITVLTPRAGRVVFARGWPLESRDRAQTLFVSTRTITTHVEHIFAKLGVNSRAGGCHAARPRRSPLGIVAGSVMRPTYPA